MKRRTYANNERLITFLTARHALKGNWLARMTVKMEDLGVSFPESWNSEKRDAFIEAFLNTTSIDDVGTKLSLLTGKETSNTEALNILTNIIETIRRN